MKTLAIARNTFLQTIRQPIYGILILVTFTILVLAVPLAGWTMGESGGDYHDTDQKMLENLGLSTLLVGGLFIAAFSASSVLAREIEDHTALTVISKPISRPVFVLGKFSGVAAAVALAYYLCSLVFLMTIRHRVMPAASDPYDIPVIVLGVSAFVLAIVVALAGNYVFGWQFTSSGVWTAALLLTLAMGSLVFVGKGWRVVPPGYDVKPEYQVRIVLKAGENSPAFMEKAKKEGLHVFTSNVDESLTMMVPPGLTMEQATGKVQSWKEVASAGPAPTRQPVIHGRLLAAMVLTLMGVLILTAVAITASTRLGQVMTLLATLGVFVAGSMHPALKLWSYIAAVRPVQWLTPNFNYFYAMDALSQPIAGKTPVVFLGWAAVYCLLYTGAVLALGVALFQKRELAAHEGSSAAPAAVGLLAGLGRIGAALLCFAGAIAISLPQYRTASGIAVAAGMMVAAAGLWVLLGCFAKGAKWSYWLVLSLAVICLSGSGAIIYFAAAADKAPTAGVLGAIVGACLVGMLALPKTRRHFA